MIVYHPFPQESSHAWTHPHIRWLPDSLVYPIIIHYIYIPRKCHQSSKNLRNISVNHALFVATQPPGLSGSRLWNVRQVWRDWLANWPYLPSCNLTVCHDEDHIFIYFSINHINIGNCQWLCESTGGYHPSCWKLVKSDTGITPILSVQTPPFPVVRYGISCHFHSKLPEDKSSQSIGWWVRLDGCLNDVVWTDAWLRPFHVFPSMSHVTLLSLFYCTVHAQHYTFLLYNFDQEYYE